MTAADRKTPQPDLDWLDEGVAWGWQLPPKAHPLLRRYGIRHIRSAWMVVTAYLWLIPCKPNWSRLWNREWTAYAIRRGWC